MRYFPTPNLMTPTTLAKILRTVEGWIPQSSATSFAVKCSSCEIGFSEVGFAATGVGSTAFRLRDFS